MINKEMPQMTSKLQQMGKFAVPALLVGMMAGCATTSDLEKVQKQVDQLNVTANNASTASQEAKSVANEARSMAYSATTASASAEKASSEANGFAAAAMKGSEAAATAAMQAQKTVSEATIAFPMMQYDPASRRFLVKWMIWPGMGQQAAASPAPDSQAPATNGTTP
jgi:murein lipoprotein